MLLVLMVGLVMKYAGRYMLLLLLLLLLLSLLLLLLLLLAIIIIIIIIIIIYINNIITIKGIRGAVQGTLQYRRAIHC